MPYARKQDKAKQMRRYRRRKKQEKLNFAEELRRRDAALARDLSRKFPWLFPKKKRRET